MLLKILLLNTTYISYYSVITITDSKPLANIHECAMGDYGGHPQQLMWWDMVDPYWGELHLVSRTRKMTWPWFVKNRRRVPS